MFQIGVVDDHQQGRDQLTSHLRRFQHERGVALAVRTWPDGADLVEGYRPDLDVLFLDVEMPRTGGFEAARAVRALDQRVAIVFVTRMAQLAIRGYEVDALSYLVKPVPYGAFAQELGRALRRVRRAPAADVLLPTARGIARVDPADIVYVSSSRHRITVHAVGRQYVFSGTLKAVEEQLAGRGFLRCNTSFLVNLRHVHAIHRSSCLVLGGDELPISRGRRREFLEAMTDQVGGGGVR